MWIKVKKLITECKWDTSHWLEMSSMSTRFFVKYFISIIRLESFLHAMNGNILLVFVSADTMNIPYDEFQESKRFFFVIKNFRKRGGFKIEQNFIDIQRQMYFITN